MKNVIVRDDFISGELVEESLMKHVRVFISGEVGILLEPRNAIAGDYTVMFRFIIRGEDTGTWTVCSEDEFLSAHCIKYFNAVFGKAMQWCVKNTKVHNLCGEDIYTFTKEHVETYFRKEYTPV